MSKFRILFFLLIIALLFKNSGTGIFASEKFAISYENVYQVAETGTTTVNQTISLRNLTSDYYPSEYSLSFAGHNIYNVNARDALGPLKLSVNKKDEETQINVVFNEKSAGINKILKWYLYYETDDLAFKNGLVWEIYLPGSPRQESLDEYNLTLSVPKSFGPVLYLSPEPKKNYYWTKEEITRGGVSAGFGRYQIFDFKLIYHLINPKIIPIKTEISLPPNTAYQQINYKSLVPAPENVEVDADGNWLARYDLKPQEKIQILAEGFAKLYEHPQIKEILGGEQKKQLLAPQPYWESNDEIIVLLSRQFKTPRKIYDYVVSELNYDYQKVSQKTKRLGALSVLSQKNQAICIEFTDLFVALARAAGIPARINNGYAYTTNNKLRPLIETNDILHAWPEYYDFNLQSWVMIDPTWGKTTNGLDYFNKLDLNHFVFVKKGQSSQYPPSAGSYKDPSANQKDVFVSFSEIDKEIKPGRLQVYFYLPEKTRPISLYKGVIEIINTGPGIISINQIKAGVDSSFLNIQIKPGLIPPFGKIRIPVNYAWKFNQNFITKPEKHQLILTVNNEVYSQPITLMPNLSWLLIIFIGGICVFIIFIITGKTRGLSFFKPKK